MIITEIEHDPPYPDRLLGPANEAGTSRSLDTLHLSTIIRDLEETCGKESTFDEADLAFFRAGGFLWEHAFGLGHREAVLQNHECEIIRPGEWEREGIVGSPDGIRADPYRIVETKCTWRSMRKLDSLEKHFWGWTVQMMAYCSMIGSTEAELHVFFVCGNYRPPFPAVRSLLLEFDEQELMENWRMVTGHARRMGWLR